MRHVRGVKNVMATIGGGGAEVTISPPPATGDGNVQAFNHAISEVQGAIDGGARVEVYDPLNPPSASEGQARAANQPFVLLVDKETLDASGTVPVINVPQGVDYLVIEDGVSVPVTVQGSEDSPVTVVGGTGNGTYFVNGPSTLIDTGGTNFAILNDTVGSEVRFGDGNDTIIAGSGDDTVVAGRGDDLTFLGAGNDSAFVQGNDTIFTGSGNDTVSVDFGNVFVTNESGNLTFINGQDASTVLGGSGSTTIFGGAGGGLYVGGAAGNNVMTAGEGATTLIGGGAGDVLFAAGSTGDLLIAGSGNTTLSGGTSTGSNTFMAGSGNDLIIGGVGSDTIFAGGGDDTAVGGAGDDVFTFMKGLTDGGSITIGDFVSGADKIDLEGFKGKDNIAQLLKHQVNTPAGTVVSLSDGTEITFTGLDELKRSDFV